MNEWRTIGMLIFNEELRQEAMKELRVVRGLEEEDDHLEEEALEDESLKEEALEPRIDDLTDARGYDRLYEWEMLLEEDELEFEYLSPHDETQDEISQRQRELREIEGRKRKLCLGVRFTGARVKGSVQELEHAAEKLGLVEKDFVQQTLRALSWIKNGRIAGGKNRRGDSVLPGVEKILVTKVFESLECVYAKVLEPNVLVKEIHRCTGTFAVGGKKSWTEG